MDKNFIKIDDLVRQRLVGGEERERSGAWLNMRDVLDKEMPQEERRIGIFYWRRLFSVVAALSLVGTVAVGSYEFSNAFRTHNVVESGVPGIEAVNNEPAATFGGNGTETLTRDEQRVAGRPHGRVSGNVSEKPRHVVAASGNNNEAEITLDRVAGTTRADGSAPGTITIDGNTHKGADVKRNKNKTFTTRKETVAVKGGTVATNNNNNSEQGAGRLTVASSVSKTNIEKTAGTQTANDAARTVGVDNKLGSTGVVSSENTGGITGNATTQSRRAEVGVAAETAAKRTKNIGSGKSNSVTGKTENADMKNGRPVLSSGVAGNSRATGTGNTSATTTGINSVSTSAGVVVSEGKSAAAAPVAVAALVASGTGSVSATTNNSPVVSSATNASEKAAAKEERNVALNNTSVARNDPALKDAKTEANNSQGKKVITKLLVHTRNIKIAENEYALKEDTISMEKVNMDLGLVAAQPAPAPASADMSATVSGKRASKRAIAGRGNATVSGNNGSTSNNASGVSGISTTGGAAGRAAAGKPGSSQGAAKGVAESEEESGLAAASASGNTDAAAKSASQAIVPASAATEMATSTETAKAKIAAKQGAGASLVNKMLAAFNDIKENASRTHFVPGITAGINANFFGPSSFKGFQFGLTGDIIFNEKWNIMTEFKYFHRLNNSTQVDDNFYTYTQVGSQYRKDLQLNSYSFSALHSLELPVSVRYHQGKFDFYAGGNFLYAFSINTGAATQPAVGIAPEFVSAPGNDNAPTLNEADFNSRFGLGYLFGFSYQVAPKFNIDLRNVQTVWDNAASTGAKSVSNQLYKTPSLQLSIMYRLGGNRNKD